MKIKTVAERQKTRAELAAINDAAGKAGNVNALREEVKKLIQLVEKHLNP